MIQTTENNMNKLKEELHLLLIEKLTGYKEELDRLEIMILENNVTTQYNQSEIDDINIKISEISTLKEHISILETKMDLIRKDLEKVNTFEKKVEEYKVKTKSYEKQVTDLLELGQHNTYFIYLYLIGMSYKQQRKM